jgi:hypothetical protein
MASKRIEIVAIGEKEAYSVGAIAVSEKGDVYLIHKIGKSDFHESRHASGELHWISGKSRIRERIRDGTPVADFKGLENLGTRGFGLESLPKLYKEYEVKQCDGIFVFDMRDYTEAAFNMTIWMLTKDGLLELLRMLKSLAKVHTYIYSACHPMIAITVFDAKPRS